MSINRFVGVGRLTKDVDLRYTQEGKAVANFTVAINRPFKTEAGEQGVDFLNAVIWGKSAENLANYMKKGSQIGVDGRIQTRNYDGSDGKKVYVTEIVADSVQFLESKGSSQGKGAPLKTNQQQSNKTEDPFSGQGDPIDISDDDLPF